MAEKKNGQEAYVPDERTQALAFAYMDGDDDETARQTLKTLYRGDARFRKWYDAARHTRGRVASAFGGGNGAAANVGHALPGVERALQAATGRASYAGSPSSPGGFKKSGRDADSALRRSGTMTPDSVLRNVGADGFDFGDDGSLTNRTSVKVGGRKYGKREIESVVRRGLSGATMNWRDQALYDAYVKRQGDREREAAQTAAQGEARLAAERQAAAAKAEEESKEQARRAKNREYGVPEDVVLSEKEMDDLRRGTVRWGLTKREEAERRKVEDEMARIAADPSTDPKDIAALREKAAAYKARFVPRLTDTEPDERTPRQKFEQSVVEVEDPNEPGRKVKFVLDKDGRATRLDFGTSKKAERPAEETFKGFTFKDFVNAMPKTRSGAVDPETGEAAVEEIPFLERVRMAEEAWARRNGDPAAATAAPQQAAARQAAAPTADAAQAPQPTAASAAQDWKSFFKGKGAASAPTAARAAATPPAATEQTQTPAPEPQTGGANCPECGATLAPDGSCPFCGYHT